MEKSRNMLVLFALFLILPLASAICSSDLECNDNNPKTSDQCINPGTGDSYCNYTTIACLSDLDCGITGFIGSEFCFQNNVFKNFQNATCLNPGAVNSRCIVTTLGWLINDCNDQNPLTFDLCVQDTHAYCSHSFIQPTIACYNDSQCNDGNTHTQDVCLNPGTPQSSCQHNNIACLNNIECGTNFLSGNSCSGLDVIKNWMNFTCNNAGQVNSFCSNNSGSYLIQTCVSSCSDGQCTNPFVACSSNSECGTNRYIGDEFCSQGDVSRDFLSFTCNSPGTISSYCTNSTDEQEIENCDHGCHDGECKEESNCDNCGNRILPDYEEIPFDNQQENNTIRAITIDSGTASETIDTSFSFFKNNFLVTLLLALSILLLIVIIVLALAR